MDKDFWKAFLRFLDEGSDTEIYDRLIATRKLYDDVICHSKNSELRYDAKKMIKFLEQEYFARKGLGS